MLATNSATGNKSRYERRGVAKSEIFHRISIKNGSDIEAFDIMGKFNGRGGWFFFECDHAVQRCAEREEECCYEEDDLHIVISQQLDSVFSSYLPSKDEFKVVHGDAKPQRLQIRDMQNDSVSSVLIVDQDTHEVLVVTVLTPTEEHDVRRKDLFVAEIRESSKYPDGIVQLRLYDNRRGYSDGAIAETFCDDTAWL
jgi:hypothetical protein